MKNKKEYQTGEAWLKSIKDVNYRERALKNSEGRLVMTAMYPSLSKTVEVAFEWFHSPEKWNFWNKFHQQILKKEQNG